MCVDPLVTCVGYIFQSSMCTHSVLAVVVVPCTGGVFKSATTTHTVGACVAGLLQLALCGVGIYIYARLMCSCFRNYNRNKSEVGTIIININQPIDHDLSSTPPPIQCVNKLLHSPTCIRL